MGYRLIIADDHPLLVGGVQRVLEEMDDVQIADTVSNGRELLTRLRQSPVDMVLLDLHMPGLDGIETLKVLQREFPTVKVLVYTTYHQPAMIREARSSGAAGLLPKSSVSGELKEAVRAVAGGGSWFKMAEVATEHRFTNDFIKKYQISSREVEVLRMIAEGYTTKEIGKKLFLSEFTINAHRRNICRKLDINTPVGLVRFAKDHGLI